MFKRIGNLIRSIINAILGRAEEKVTVSRMELALREIRQNFAQYQESVAKAIAYEKKAQRKFDEEQKRYDRLTEQATVAAQRSLDAATDKEKTDNENLAKRALQLRRDCAHRLEIFKSTYEKAQVQAKEARDRLVEAQKAIEERKVQLKHAKVLDELNKTKREVAEIPAKLDIDSAMSVFDKGMEHVVDESETLKAMDELALSEGEKLDARLEEITKKDEISSEFEELLNQISSKKTGEVGKVKETPEIDSTKAE